MGANKAIKASPNRERGHRSLGQLRREGYEIRKITPYQWRINEVLDCFPTSDRYHLIPRDERGDYFCLQDLRDLLNSLANG